MYNKQSTKFFNNLNKTEMPNKSNRQISFFLITDMLHML